MYELNLAHVVLSGVVLILGLLSNYIRDRTWFSEPMPAMLIGVFAGPAFLNLLPLHWSNHDALLEEVSRLTLAIGLMAIALRLPTHYTVQHLKSLSVLIDFVMPLMWLVAAGIIRGTLGLDWTLALLSGAVIAPTDPIVASSIITGKTAEVSLPERIRHLLSAESAANDGLAYPIVLLAFFFLQPPQGSLVRYWLLHTLLWEVGAAILCGVILGYVAGWLLIWAEQRKLTDKTSFLAYTLTLSLLTLGLAKLLGTDGILAVFFAGLAFSRQVKGKERAEDADVQEAIGQFFILPAFTLFGLVITWQAWMALGWPLVMTALGILMLRRLPALWLFQKTLPEIENWKDVLFLGWFGPIGISAVFYALLIWHKTGKGEIWVVASLMVFLSVIIHGMTATPFTRLYRGKVLSAH